MKITLVIDSMKPGGAQRVMSILANSWAEKGYDISIIIFVEFDSFYPLHDSINLIQIPMIRHSKGIFDAIRENNKRVQLVRDEFKALKSDLVISFMTPTNVISILAARKLKIPVIVSERNNPRYMPLNFFWKVMRSFAYFFASHIVTQSIYTVPYLKKISFNKKVSCIYNPLEARNNNTVTDRKKIILSVGSIDKQKRHDLLLKAFDKANINGWELWIVGEINVVGQESWLKLVKNYIKKNNLKKRVKLLGVNKDIFSIYDQCSIFVLSSEREGFPNVLLEAMSSGLACVSFDCPTGPSEIITHNEDGIILPFGNVDLLAESLVTLTKDSVLRKKIGNKAKQNMNRFDMKKIVQDWDNIIIDVAGSKKNKT